MEQTSISGKFDETSLDPSEATGWLSEGMFGNWHNRQLLYKVYFAFMDCPSSPLPRFVLTDPLHNAHVMSAMYAGVSGATDHHTATDMTVGAANGRISWGGALIIGSAVKLAGITDGTSYTVIVGEQSDWCRTASGEQYDCRSDCYHGFTMGPGDDGYNRHFNLTAVIHRFNDKSWNALGVPFNCGPNRPIQSAHPGGAHVLFVDGSTHFLGEGMDTQTLYDLANRDDGHILPADY